MYTATIYQAALHAIPKNCAGITQEQLPSKPSTLPSIHLWRTESPSQMSWQFSLFFKRGILLFLLESCCLWIGSVTCLLRQKYQITAASEAFLWLEGTKPFSGKCTGSTPVFTSAVSRCYHQPCPLLSKAFVHAVAKLVCRKGISYSLLLINLVKVTHWGTEGTGWCWEMKKERKNSLNAVSRRDWKAKRHYLLELTVFFGFFRSHPQAQEPQCQFGKASTLQAQLRSPLLSPPPLLRQQTRIRSCPTVTAQASRDGAPLVQATTAPKRQLTSHGPPMAKISAGKDHGLHAAVGNAYLRERGLNQQPFLCHMWTILAKHSVSCWCLKPSQPYRCFG